MPHPTPDHLQAALIARIAALRRHVEQRIPARFRSILSADEILQETWLAAYRTRASFVDDATPHAFDRWLKAIVNSKLVDALRTVRSLKRGGSAKFIQNAGRRMTSLCDLFDRVQSPQKTPSSEFAVNEAAHAVRISLNRLSDEYRRAIELRYLNGMTTEQVARRMGKSKPAVSSLLYRGRRQLREILGSATKYLSGVRSSESDGALSPE